MQQYADRQAGEGRGQPAPRIDETHCAGAYPRGVQLGLVIVIGVRHDIGRQREQHAQQDQQPRRRRAREQRYHDGHDQQSSDDLRLALDAIGEYCYRSWTMTAGEARAANAIPCGLLQGGTVTAPIRRGGLVTYANAAPPEGSKLVELRARQDRLVYGV